MARIIGYIPPKKVKEPPGNNKGGKKSDKTDTPAAPTKGKEPPEEA